MKRPLALFCGTFIIVSLICSITEMKEAVTLCLSLLIISLAVGIIQLKKSKRFLVVGGAIALAVGVFVAGYTLCYKNAVSYAETEHTFYVCVENEKTVRVSQVDGERVVPFKMNVYPAKDKAVGEYLLITGKAKEQERSAEIYDGALYDLSKSVYLEIFYPEINETGKENFWIKTADSLRSGIKARFNSVLDEDTADKITGILLGDKSGIGYAQKNKYSASGISHIFAVSGLHLSVLVGMLVIFLRMLYLKRRSVALILSAAVIFFMWLVGFNASVQRAGIMTVIMCLSYTKNRRADPLTSLCLAGAVICAGGTFAAADCGFLLSFVAVLSLITISKYFCEFVLHCFCVLGIKNRLSGSLANVIGTSMSVLLYTLPVIVICFDSSTILAPLTNILVLWAVAPVLFLSIFLLVIPVKPIAFTLTLLVKYIDFIVDLLLEYDVIGNVFTQKITLILAMAAISLVLLCKIVGKSLVNKAIFAFVIIISVSVVAVSSLRYDGVKVIQTETLSGNAVLVIDGKKAMVIADGEFTFAPENTVYVICDLLADNGVFEIDKLVLNADSDEFENLLKANISVNETYFNADISMKFADNEVTLHPQNGVFIKRGDSTFSVIGGNMPDDMTESDVILFSESFPDVNYAAEKNVKLVIGGDVEKLTSNYEREKLLERFLKNNIYTVDDCGTIEVRTTGNGEYDIRTERDKNAYKQIRQS